MKKSDATINIRVNKKNKEEAQEILESFGLDLSAGIRLFLKQIVNHKRVPFKIVTENGYTPEEEAEMIREGAEAKEEFLRNRKKREVFVKKM